MEHREQQSVRTAVVCLLDRFLQGDIDLEVMTQGLQEVLNQSEPLPNELIEMMNASEDHMILECDGQGRVRRSTGALSAHLASVHNIWDVVTDPFQPIIRSLVEKATLDRDYGTHSALVQLNTFPVMMAIVHARCSHTSERLTILIQGVPEQYLPMTRADQQHSVMNSQVSISDQAIQQEGSANIS